MISVCIATYNGEKYIKDQLLSILKQINENDEVIISDDYSTDNTLQKIKELNDKRIKIINNKYEKGYTKNFQNAIAYSKGDYIFLSDQDDIWCDNKIKRVVFYLENGYDFIVHDAQIVNENLQLIENSFFNYRRSKPGLISNIIRFSYLGCCMAFNKKIKNKILPFPENQKLCTHDNWIYLVSSMFFKVYHLNDKLIKYRRHNFNTSTGGKKTKINIFFMLSYRIYVLFHLFMRIK